MKISLIYDNTVYREELESDWGFAALVEAVDRTILFDAGSDGRILLENMKKMNINPKNVDTVFMSHHHFDHTGGLASFLEKNGDVDVYVPRSLRGIRRARSIHHLEDATEIAPGIWSTGEMMDIEQAMVVKTEKGNVLIVGCSHPGLDKIMDRATQWGPLYAVVGGFHGFENLKALADVQKICPTHCTQKIKEICKMYPQKYIQGGAGRVIKL